MVTFGAHYHAECETFSYPHSHQVDACLAQASLSQKNIILNALDRAETLVAANFCERAGDQLILLHVDSALALHIQCVQPIIPLRL
jgi:hypothetical protein